MNIFIRSSRDSFYQKVSRLLEERQTTPAEDAKPGWKSLV